MPLTLCCILARMEGIYAGRVISVTLGRTMLSDSIRAGHPHGLVRRLKTSLHTFCRGWSPSMIHRHGLRSLSLGDSWRTSPGTRCAFGLIIPAVPGTFQLPCLIFLSNAPTQLMRL